MRKEKTKIDGKKISVYIDDDMSVPIIFSNDVADSSGTVRKECEKINCRGFHFVSITGLRWDEELSPWAHDPVVAKNDHFTGEADQYLDMLETKIVPYVKELIPGSQFNILHGYSMGGLFALYAAHKSTFFDAYSAPSGSVWYPDFVSYVTEHDFAKKPKAVYLSLGDKESKTKNEYMSKTEVNMQVLLENYRKQGILSIFDLNAGGHFKDVNKRVAKGLRWTLNCFE